MLSVISDLVERMKKEEMTGLGGDINGLIGCVSDGAMHGWCGFGDTSEMILCALQFKKDKNQLVSYSLHGTTTTVHCLWV